MPDNILIRIEEGLADVRRMLARVHADIQVVKHDIERFRNLGQNKTLHPPPNVQAHVVRLITEERRIPRVDWPEITSPYQ